MAKQRGADKAAPATALHHDPRPPPPPLPAVAPTTTTLFHLPKLASCKSCAVRKVKCDSARPACGPCEKNNTECINVDSSTGEQFPRAYIHELEQKVYGPQTGSKRTASQQQQQDTSPSNLSTITPARSIDAPSATLHGAGLSFMSSLFTDPAWRSKHSTLLQSLTSASQQAAASPGVAPSPLPASAAEARGYFDSYLREDHVHKPILSLAEIESLFHHIYTSDGLPRTNLQRHTLYRAHMIMAIGTIIPFRHNTCKHHPSGFFLSAMEHLEATFLSGELGAIQDLLLIARFGIYYHIGASIWEIVRLSMRMCVEQRLHKKSAPGEFTPMQEQMRRRVFWVVYLMDRYSSSTLSRPFAISDQEISIPLLVDADDVEISLAAQRHPSSTLDKLGLTSQTGGQGASPRPSEASVLLLTVKLRQISSDVNNMFSTLMRRRVSGPDSSDSDDSALTATGRICEIIDAIVLRMEDWRRGAPVFAHPRSLYERGEWYDLLKTREIFNTMRRAIDASPKRDGGVPPRHVLVQCLEWAIRIIDLYSDLFERAIVTNTRSYFQLMVNAGFSVLYIASVSTPAVLTPEIAAQCRETLDRCGKTLLHMTVDLANSRHYVAVFDALHHHLSHKLRIVQSRRPSPPRLGRDSGGAAHGPQLPAHTPNGSTTTAAAPRFPNDMSDASAAAAGYGPNQPPTTGLYGPSSGTSRASSWAYSAPALFNVTAPMGSGSVHNSGSGANGGEMVPALDNNHSAWLTGQYYTVQQLQQQHQQADYRPPQHDPQHPGGTGPPQDGAGVDLTCQLNDTSELLNWDFLHDEVLWNMGNFVYGGSNEGFGIHNTGHLP